MMVCGGGLFSGCPTTVHGWGNEDAVLFKGALEDSPVCVEAAGGAESRVYGAMEFLGGEGDDVGFEVDCDLCVCVVEVFYSL